MPRQKLLSEKEKLERKRASYHRWYQRNKEIRRASQKRWFHMNKGNVNIKSDECVSAAQENIAYVTQNNMVYLDFQNSGLINTEHGKHSNLTLEDSDITHTSGNVDSFRDIHAAYLEFSNDVGKSNIMLSQQEKNVILECSRCYALSSIGGTCTAPASYCHHSKVNVSLKSENSNQ